MDAIPLVGYKSSDDTAGVEKVKNPGPKPADSQVPDVVKTLTVDLAKAKLDSDTSRGLRDFRRAADYIAAGELYHHWLKCSIF